MGVQAASLFFLHRGGFRFSAIASVCVELPMVFGCGAAFSVHSRRIVTMCAVVDLRTHYKRPIKPNGSNAVTTTTPRAAR